MPFNQFSLKRPLRVVNHQHLFALDVKNFSTMIGVEKISRNNFQFQCNVSKAMQFCKIASLSVFRGEMLFCTIGYKELCKPGQLLIMPLKMNIIIHSNNMYHIKEDNNTAEIMNGLNCLVRITTQLK